MGKVKLEIRKGLDMSGTALKVVLNILELWQCSSTEKRALLGIEHATLLHISQQLPKTVDPDVLERVSVLLNIHSALRVLFDAPESAYGWVRKPNESPLYAGRSAMDIMLQGRIADLYKVMSYLEGELH